MNSTTTIFRGVYSVIHYEPWNGLFYVTKKFTGELVVHEIKNYDISDIESIHSYGKYSLNHLYALRRSINQAIKWEKEYWKKRAEVNNENI